MGQVAKLGAAELAERTGTERVWVIGWKVADLGTDLWLNLVVMASLALVFDKLAPGSVSIFIDSFPSKVPIVIHFEHNFGHENIAGLIVPRWPHHSPQPSGNVRWQQPRVHDPILDLVGPRRERTLARFCDVLDELHHVPVVIAPVVVQKLAHADRSDFHRVAIELTVAHRTMVGFDKCLMVTKKKWLKNNNFKELLLNLRYNFRRCLLSVRYFQ